MGEKILLDYFKNKPNCNLSLLRYFNPIGAHSSGKIGELPIGVPNNLVPFIMQTATGKREALTVFGNDYDTPDGYCIRDYIHVVDLADAHVLTLKIRNEQTTPSIDIECRNRKRAFCFRSYRNI